MKSSNLNENWEIYSQYEDKTMIFLKDIYNPKFKYDIPDNSNKNNRKFSGTLICRKLNRQSACLKMRNLQDWITSYQGFWNIEGQSLPRH